MRRLLVLAFLSFAASVLLMPANAKADSFTFSISGAGISASGVFTTNSESDGSYLVTSISGTLNGSSMALVAPGEFDENDNLLFLPGAPEDLDGGGISFAVNGVDYNLFYRPAASSYVLDIGPGSVAAVGEDVTFDPLPGTAALPEPPSMLLIAIGLGGVGLLFGRKLRLTGA